MKNLMIILSVASSLAMLSCSKDSETRIESSWNTSQNTRLYPGTIQLGRLETKSTTAASEDAVKNIQIFIFNENGAIENYYSGTEKSVTMRLSAGKKDVRVLVNSTSYGTVSATLADLENKISSFSENTADNLVMVGESSAEITGPWTLPVEVRRLSSKVVVNEIDTEFTSPVYSGGQFIIKKIYLTNTPSEYPYFKVPSSFSYGTPGSLTSDMNLNETLTGNGSYSKSHTFYTYPNNDTDRPTRLVIYATLNGVPYYYPINLGEIGSNTIYEITKVTITRPGSSSEDDVIEGFDGSCNISIGQWNPDSEKINETI